MIVKKSTLSDAWYKACLELWYLANKHNVKTNTVTIWDAFKLLYFESVPDNLDIGRGRKARGVDHVTD